MACGVPRSAAVTTVPIVLPRNPPVPNAKVRKNRLFSSSQFPEEANSAILDRS